MLKNRIVRKDYPIFSWLLTESLLLLSVIVINTKRKWQDEKKQNYPLIEALEITTLAAEGKAMGRYNEQVVFVPMTVPGDVVDVQIRNMRRRQGRRNGVGTLCRCRHIGATTCRVWH